MWRKDDWLVGNGYPSAPMREACEVGANKLFHDFMEVLQYKVIQTGLAKEIVCLGIPRDEWNRWCQMAEGKRDKK